jgi:hypothetical protein
LLTIVTIIVKYSVEAKLLHTWQQSCRVTNPHNFQTWALDVKPFNHVVYRDV